MNPNWENLDKNLIARLALDLDLKSILSLCRTSKKFNLIVCQSDSFWYNKFVQDFVFKPTNYLMSKTYYKLLHNFDGSEWREVIKKSEEKGYDDLTNFLNEQILFNFGGDINSLKNIENFNKITHLTFAKRFNQPTSKVYLPPTLTNLTFGYLFNQPISKGDLPQTLTNLTFGKNFNQQI